MKKIFLSLILLTCVSFTIKAQDDGFVSKTWSSKEVPKKISMCWHEGLPYASASLENGGLVAEFVRTVMLEAGFTAKILFIPWSRCREGVRKKQYDMLFAMWNNVDQHVRDFDFLEATNNESVALFTLKSSKIKTSDIKKMGKVSLGAHIHGGYDESILKNKSVDMVFVRNDRQKINMLLAKRIDLFISEPQRVEVILKTFSEERKSNIIQLEPLLRKELSSPAILKTNPHKKEIMKRYSAAYNKLCKSGKLKEIIQKHGFAFKPLACK
ncbi:hypothetical protein A9Q84_03970 [Halobacteriovorax marinus]|uniref:Solute-binding protein family 3/N-terminal domain-containing protein n=1 Tax=Halobacteriovorax marinus TaxID=97084 RepID=A0A1Y5FA88_9BACT|nr:hypothetical protein A9Q84_03970 [Halobacteriovorax marinus]